MLNIKERLGQIKLKTKLSMAFIAILIIPSFIVGVSSYDKAKTDLNETILQTAKDNVSILNKIVDDELENKYGDVTHFAKILTQGDYNADQLQNVQSKFDQYIQLHPEIETIYTTSSNNQFIHAPVGKVPEGFNPLESSWYKDAVKANGEIIVSSPYKSKATGNMVIAIAKQNADKSGVIGVDLNIDDIVKTSKMIKIGKQGFVSIVSQDKTIVVHPTLKPGEKLEKSLADELYKKEDGVITYTLNGEDRNISFKTNKKTGWKIAGVMPTKEIEEATNPIFYKTLTIIGGSLLLGGIVIFFILKSIINPLRQLVISAQRISQGDLTEKIDIRSKDELGQLGGSFNTMAESLRNIISRINTSAGHVAASSEELTASVEQASVATEQITKEMEEISNSAEVQNNEVESGAELIGEVTRNIQYVAENASEVSASSIYTKQKANEGEQLVEQTVTQMQSIHHSVSQSDNIIKLLDKKSQQIGSILEAIQNIAEQTNLLALNAAIEAARAGEQGRGFAIVADEVRKLAEQSSESSMEIGCLISEIQADVHETVKAMNEVGVEVQSGIQVANDTKQSFYEISKSANDIVSKVHGMVELSNKMTSDAMKVDTSINQISMAVKENSSSMQTIAGSSEEQHASMEEINSSAVQLAQMAEELQELIGGFKI
ncbi:methyl-accepting chemotaxis protein [Bacillus cereus group sp. BfR-BA-01119]|uniref:methyl-accepting chemotaxis protein n=1 Tax=Bacillus cereus group TaxID=86661 RepID=UPI000772A7A6|nr:MULTISPECIES: methyl-accepting chemotaxis protein [Bacillus cereus group]ONG61819.1 chemotaxis protein [Bacillus cereus]MCH5437729.1 methyl-accepting chemotaxis protein [Bacillus paranthracis]MDA2195111.1 methyl-accepting chemotaxis protein [Bacillus cereus group sp. Bc238]MDA2200876.1 methyl-accepting chemotaxis protein [Bacillus cereus group sp. Bc237]MDA2760497.1 methyl-accepting chemotaxis protein [Bacillus cereus group sp. Bc007]